MVRVCSAESVQWWECTVVRVYSGRNVQWWECTVCRKNMRSHTAVQQSTHQCRRRLTHQVIADQSGKVRRLHAVEDVDEAGAVECITGREEASRKQAHLHEVGHHF